MANPLAALKTTSRADYVFARLEAKRAGARKHSTRRTASKTTS